MKTRLFCLGYHHWVPHHYAPNHSKPLKLWKVKEAPQSKFGKLWLLVASLRKWPTVPKKIHIHWYSFHDSTNKILMPAPSHHIPWATRFFSCHFFPLHWSDQNSMKGCLRERTKNRWIFGSVVFIPWSSWVSYPLWITSALSKINGGQLVAEKCLSQLFCVGDWFEAHESLS